MGSLLRSTASTITKLIGKEHIADLIAVIARFASVDLLVLAYNKMGILKYQNDQVSGEHFLVTEVLKKNFTGRSHLVFFDVGANVGRYTSLLVESFPNALVYSFEPNKRTYQALQINVGSAAKCINAGLGAEEAPGKIFTYSDDPASSHASSYRDVFHEVHKRDDIIEFDITTTTLDLFCAREQLAQIDFLKIDTEGNELKVLQGAKGLLDTRRIPVIQFEFGECNVFSRVFLHDIYRLLSDYDIYRLDSNRLIPLFQYSPANEIFRFQNMLAVRKDVAFIC